MIRMTSDVEALQQMLQEGLVQFAVQGLTMLVVTVILFFYSVTLALITLVLIVPALTILSLWFRSASDRGYNQVRDGIAGVLSDLSESLSGVRVVGFNRTRHNVINHRNVVGEYCDQRLRPASPRPTAREVSSSVYRPGRAPGIGGTMVHKSRSILNALFQPIQQLVQQTTLTGSGRDHQDQRPADYHSERPGVRRRPAAPADQRRSRPYRRVVRLRPRDSGVARRRSAHRGRGDDVVRRRDRCRKVHDCQARDAVLRPHRGERHDRRSRPRDVTIASCAHNSGLSPGAFPLRRQHARQHQVETRRYGRRDLEAVRAWAHRLVDRLPEGLTRPCTNACRSFR